MTNLEIELNAKIILLKQQLNFLQNDLDFLIKQVKAYTEKKEPEFEMICYLKPEGIEKYNLDYEIFRQLLDSNNTKYIIIKKKK
jgi:hypothetical protein